MTREKDRTSGLGFVAAGIVCVVCGLGFLVLDQRAESAAAGEPRPDVIFIDAMRTFGELERSPSIFKHDYHVEKLSSGSEKADCRLCHLTGPDSLLSFRFMRLTDSTYQEVKNLYHDACVACHQERAANRSPGAEACGRCHQRRPALVSSRQPMGMDNSLHARHVKAHEGKCEGCHHKYDEQKQTLFYAKGEEGSCRQCHRERTEDNRVAFRFAAHQACVNCHLGNGKGPVECAGCHDAARQAAIARLDPVPRLERGQPNVVLIHAAQEDLPASKLPTVPFNHEAHERFNATCRVCHHEGMQACRNCHTLAGRTEGGGIPLAIAMHAPGIDHSCIGCHERQMRQSDCSGCHAFMGSKALAESYCQQCHNGPLPDAVAASGEEGWPTGELSLKRTLTPLSFTAEDVPDSVTVAHMVDKYDAAVFPHRRIIEALRRAIAGNELATHAHGREDMVCQGCHHHSPVGVRPPLCSSCHGVPFRAENLHVPGLYGAFHRQCLGCHQQMGQSTECTKCHAERHESKLSALAGSVERGRGGN